MNLKRLQYFLAVAEHQSFRLAADALHISQPPLTRAIKQLEGELGVQLFHRTTRCVSLTPDGEAFFEKATALQANIDDFEQDVKAYFQRDDRETLTIGVTTLALPCVLPMLDGFVEQRWPKKRYKVVEQNLDKLVENVEAKTISLGFMLGSINNKDLNIEMINEIVFEAAVSTELGFIDGQSVTLHDLKDLPIIAHANNDGIAIKAAIQDAYMRAELMPIFNENHSDGVCLSLVSARKGIHFVWQNSDFNKSDISRVVLDDDKIAVPLVMITKTMC